MKYKYIGTVEQLWDFDYDSKGDDYFNKDFEGIDNYPPIKHTILINIVNNEIHEYTSKRYLSDKDNPAYFDYKEIRVNKKHIQDLIDAKLVEVIK